MNGDGPARVRAVDHRLADRRFVLEERLGEGGFGTVYRAYDTRRREHVALKLLHRFGGPALSRFKREFRSLADLRHPNLIALHELISDGERWFFTMELIEGTSFSNYVCCRTNDLSSSAAMTLTLSSEGDTAEASTTPGRGWDATGEVGPAAPPDCGALDVERLRSALSQLADAVSALHDADRVHRDIKPSNVMVSGDGRVVLLDLGLVTDERGDSSTGGELLGTAAYMAPEQAMGGKVTEASDWYAVGAMLYEALTGRLPFCGPPLKVLIDKQEKDPPPPAAVAPDVPADLDRVTMALLSREPSARPGHREIQRLLGGIEARAPGLRPVDGHEEVFVGREAELRGLRDAFEATTSGRPVLAQLTGLSGMGKSALLGQFLADVRRTSTARSDGREAVVLAGRCYEQESVPYKAFDSVIDALCRFLRGLDPVAAAALMPRGVSALARLFPVLERVDAFRDAPTRAAGTAEPRELRQQAFAALAELLGRIADRRPLVVAIDDAQWGDIDSAVLVGELFHAAEPPSLLLIVGYRSEEQDQSPFLRELHEQTGQGVDVRNIEVNTLPEARARDLARRLLGEQAGPEVAAALARESGGSPMFVRSLVQYAISGAAPESSSGEVTVEQVVRRLVADLPEHGGRLIEVVALAGQPLHVNVAARASGLGAQFRPALAALRIARLVRACAGDDDLFECYHDRIRETVVAGLAPEDRRAWHRRLAGALEAAGTTDPEQLVMHYAGASDAELAAACAIEAAERAAEKLAFEQAARLYRLALGFGQLDGAQTQALRRSLADALANAGLGAEAAPEYLRASEGLDGAGALELRRLAAEHFLLSGKLDEGLPVAARVLSDVGVKMPSSEGTTLLTVVGRRVLLRARGVRFRRTAERDVPPDELNRLDITWAMTIGLAMIDPVRSAAFSALHVLFALRAGEPWRIARALACEAPLYSLGGRRMAKRCYALLKEAMDLANELDDEYLRGMVHLGRAATTWCLGEGRACRVAGERAGGIFANLESQSLTWELGTAWIFRLAAMIDLGDWREAASAYPAVVKAARDRGDLYTETWMHLRISVFASLIRDDPATARAQVDEAIERWSSGRFDLLRFYWIFARAHIALYEGAPEDAWEIVGQHWGDLEGSPIGRTQIFSVMGRTLRANAALAMAAQAPGNDSPELEEMLRWAKRDVRAIEKEGMAWSKPVSDRVRCTMAYLSQPGIGPLDSLAVAQRGDMRLHAAAVAYQRGLRLGGGEGRALVDSAVETMRGEGIERPDRVADMLAPGFRPIQAGRHAERGLE